MGQAPADGIVGDKVDLATGHRSGLIVVGCSNNVSTESFLSYSSFERLERYSSDVVQPGSS